MSTSVEEFRPTMQTIVVNKAELLEVLKTNRAAHEKTFNKAWKGYRETVLEILEKAYKDAQGGDLNAWRINLVQPVNQVADYDRAIRKMEMSQHDEIYLNDQEFAQYVMDDWAWKANFTASSAMYVNKA